MKKYIFLVGTGRTGTFFLKHYFEKTVSDCLAVHEPDRRIKFCTNLFLSKKITELRIHEFLKKYRTVVDQKLDSENKNIFIQSDPWFFGFLDIVEKYFDNPYIIHLVRDPLTYIPSQLNMYYDNPISGWLRDIIPYWKLRGDKTGEYSSIVWNALSQEEKVAWYWQICNSFIEDRSQKLNNYLRLYFEHLFEFSYSGARTIAEFCKIGINDSLVTESSLSNKTNTQRKRFKKSSAWSIQKLERVIAICEKLREKYGYI